MEINNSDYISKPNIALKLNKSEDLIDEAFSQLLRMEYIREDDNTNICSAGCGSCPYARSCNKTPVNTIMVTEKGKKLLKKYFIDF